MQLSWEKLIFHYKWFSVGDGFRVRDWFVSTSPFSVSPNLGKTCVGPVHTISDSMSWYVQKPCCIKMDGCVLHPLCLLHSFCLFLLLWFSCALGWVIDGNILFRTDHFIVFPFCAYCLAYWVPIFVPIYLKENIFWWLLVKSLIYEYRKMSPEVILFLCFFSRTVVLVLLVFRNLVYIVSGT